MRELLFGDQGDRRVAPIRPPIPERVNFRRELGDLISLPPKTLRRLQRAIDGCHGLALNWAADQSEDITNPLWRLMIIASPPSGQISCLGLVPNHRDRLYALTAYQCDYRGQPDPWKSARIFFFDNGVIVKHHHRSPRPLLPEEKKRIIGDFQSLLGLGGSRSIRRFSLVFYAPDNNPTGWIERQRTVISVRSLSVWLLDQSRGKKTP